CLPRAHQASCPQVPPRKRALDPAYRAPCALAPGCCRRPSAQLLQLLLERLDASAGFWVAFAESTEQYRDLLRSVLLLRARRQRPRRRAAEQRDELAPSIKKTRSHGTIAKRAGLAKRPRSAKGLPFSSSRVGRKGRCVTHSITSSARASSVGGTSRPSITCGLSVNDELELAHLLDRQFPWLCTLEDATGIDAERHATHPRGWARSSSARRLRRFHAWPISCAPPAPPP